MRHPVASSRLAQALLLLAAFAGVPLRAADPIQEVGKITAEWVRTRAETNRLETGWVQEKALLASTLNGLKERADRLQDKRDHLLATTASERTEMAALTAKLTDAKDALKQTESRLLVLSDKILKLRPQLPPRLATALEMSYRSLAGKELSPGERMQLIMTVLNRCAQFNLSIDQGDEVLTLPGESAPKSVDVIYWGLSQGYALDRAAGKAWLGAPGPEGWHWEALEGAAPAVAGLFAIRRDEADPQLVTVPVRLKAAP
jgi:hypothetical protein